MLPLLMETRPGCQGYCQVSFEVGGKFFIHNKSYDIKFDEILSGKYAPVEITENFIIL